MSPLAVVLCRPGNFVTQTWGSGEVPAFTTLTTKDYTIRYFASADAGFELGAIFLMPAVVV